MIHFFCKCGQPMSVKPEYIGKTGQCPRCKQPITVPPQSQRGMPQPQVQPPPAPPSGSTQPYDRGRVPPIAPPHNPPNVQTNRYPGRGAKLEVVHGPAGLMGKVYTLDPGRGAVIGRDPDSEVSVPSDRVSRRHCQLSPKADGSYVVSDMGSSNGTLVNQIRLNGPQLLQGGEYIQTGDCLFRFVTG